MSLRWKVAAALTPAGKTVAKSVSRTPRGESCEEFDCERVFEGWNGLHTSKHKPLKTPSPDAGTGGMLPTHRPFAHPTPVVILTWNKL